MLFSIRCSFMRRSFMLPTPAFPAANASVSVPLAMFGLRTESLYGEITVRTVWRVSAAVLRKRLNTASTAKAYRAIFAQNKYHKIGEEPAILLRTAKRRRPHRDGACLYQRLSFFRASTLFSFLTLFIEYILVTNTPLHPIWTNFA